MEQGIIGHMKGRQPITGKEESNQDIKYLIPKRHQYQAEQAENDTTDDAQAQTGGPGRAIDINQRVERLHFAT